MKDPDIDNRNNPSYLSHYGMYRPPFMTNMEDDMYYPEPTRTQRLDILLHLAQYGNELLLVTGPDGSGKTVMLQQFIKKASSDWKICQINAHNMLDDEQLINRISRGFDFPEEKTGIETGLRNLRRRLEALLTNHPTVVIVVDNAQQLENEVLDTLLGFSNIRNINKGTSVRILLFSEPQIKIHLASPELQSKQTMPIRKVDLPALDEQQTGKLIRHRVTTAGLASKSVFNDSIINKIYKFSDGWPGAITEIAHQVLFESTPVKRRDTPHSKSTNGESSLNGKKIGLIIGVVLIIFALVAVLLFQSEINNLFTKPVQEIAKSTESTQNIQALAIPVKPSTSMNIDEAVDIDEQEFPQLQAIGNEPDPQTIVEAVTESKQSNVTVIKIKPEPKTPIAKTLTPKPKSSSTAQLVVLEKTKTGTTVKPYEDNKTTSQLPLPSQQAGNVPLAKQGDWLLEQQPDFFTLQILAGYQESTMVKFVNQGQLPDSDLAYFFSLNRGKNWHSLVFGLFPNHAQASGAAKQLTQKIKGIKPWIRSLKSIQNDIRYARSRRAKTQ